MNREQRRYLQRQGQLDDEGNPVAAKRSQATAHERVAPRQYLSEVNSELRRVTWPDRRQIINYTIVVLITVALVTSLIAFLDWGFGKAVISLLRLGTPAA